MESISGLRLGIVDDGTDICVMLNRFIRLLTGNEAPTFPSYDSIVSKFQTYRDIAMRFDALILDVCVPGAIQLVGFTTGLREASPNFPIVLHTGSSGDNPIVSEFGKNIPNAAFLKKPSNYMSDLPIAVNAAMSRTVTMY